ncbi:hypothetical protein [Agreia sp. COWG]|uniref:hypothetical protein n=1 Tax=Agreia sp. COWG TaxID=2773266 RepID=UPI00192888B0|nr:hypothetical protein [Agreia sp. COWG]CAD5998463.1 conserved protein of unknown function [Agreia sp. COWG]
MTSFTPSPPSPDALITNDPDARAMLAGMLGPALRRQLWAFFLDTSGRPLPVLIPIDGIPVTPSADDLRVIVAGLGSVLDAHAQSGSILLALERPGDAAPHGFDELWADGLHDAAMTEHVALFGIYLVSSDGLRMMKPSSPQHR